ncbi:hypothetical protein Z517_01224 [Fonsecaea pedrosoi CBS 271.37]|uniref:C2H2-type domain-containing protein n=1 Tax=Fonsecaea pedrosoi CBS 271.37 TaxID=1442368 RepID=A0A0D2FGL9_9EURO|nr:uncharacterized protein Z517_01224 [Fonsecaea pedrosoi CBS 271.37]KIW85832.1 hypothetical protein Z517_01224 [Fonsecaea pedrosoi CBS 271.37]
MEPSKSGFPLSWPRQLPAQPFRLSPATESSSQFELSHMGSGSPYYDHQFVGGDVRKILQDFRSDGLDRSTISYLLRPEKFIQLRQIAMVNVIVLQTELDRVYPEQPRSKAPRLTQAPEMCYPSGVPNLGSTQSQLPTSTNLGTSTTEFYTPELESQFQGRNLHLNWMSPPEGMKAMTSRDTAIHRNNPPIASTNTYSALPQRQDSLLVPNARSMASPYLQYPQSGAPRPSDVADAGIPNMVPNSATCYSAGGKPAQEYESLVDTTASTYLLSRESTARKDQDKYPCSEPGCSKRFVRAVELGNHLKGDHEQDDTYFCQHQDCTFENHRHASWARHHSKGHNSCKKGDACVKTTHNRQKMYWGCSICVHLSSDVTYHVNHHLSHFKDGSAQSSDIKYSTMILSLLSQEATQDGWEARCKGMSIQDREHHRSLTSSTCGNIRVALEYGKYRGLDLSEPNVADHLLDEVIGLISRKRKRDVPGMPNFDNSYYPLSYPGLDPANNGAVFLNANPGFNEPY